MEIAIAGLRYAGLSNAVLLAHHNVVVAVDIPAEKVAMLNLKQSLIEDAEIEDYLAHQQLNLLATQYNQEAYAGSDYIMIANPTDYDQKTNYFNTQSIEAVIQDVRTTNPQALIVIKSTVHVGCGGNTKTPFAESDVVDHLVNIYAATKKANELMAHSYSHLYGLPTTGLRFFTVYGHWGRPDMSPWLFTSAILEGRNIDVFNHGKMQRDFTYIDDIADGTVRVLDRVAQPNPAFDTNAPNPAISYAPFIVYNIGNHTPVELMTFIQTIEESLGQVAKKNFLPMQSGDVVATYADVAKLNDDTGFEPKTDLAQGISHWSNWYRSYINQLKNSNY